MSIRARHWVVAVLVALLTASILLVELGVRTPTGPRAISDLSLPGPVRPSIERLRARPFEAIADPRAAAVVSGVVFGRTEHVDPAAQAAFLDSGLWHLLAASGQNIALVAGGCVALVRVFGGTRLMGVGVALVAVPAYVLVVGGGPSIVRAGIAGELLLIAWLVGQRADAARVLLVAAVAICWLWPGAHRMLGFQLSFACVGALLWLAPRWQRTLVHLGLHRWLAAGVAATAICSLSTAPILFVRTGAAPLTGAVANVVAVPLAALILMLGLAGSLVASVVPAAGGVVLMVAGFGGALLLDVAERASELPWAQTTSPVAAVAIPVVLLAASAVSGRPRRAVLMAGSILCCVGVVIAPLVAPYVDAPSIGIRKRVSAPATGILRVAALDIGQGDSTLLELDGASMLVDVGPPGGEVAARAREAGARQIDTIVLTHDSLDHRGGLDDAVAGLDPTHLVIPRHALGTWSRVRQLGVPVSEVCAGDVLTLASARIEVLNPPCDRLIPNLTGDQHNDNAMVLLVEYRSLRVLICADAESPAVLPLRLGSVDVLRVAHHGSRDSGLSELLGALRPELALISVGERNTYGHPAPSTLAAIRLAGVRVLRTDLHGSIVLDSAGGEVVLR